MLDKQADLAEQQEECRRQGAEVQSLTSELDSARKSEADARHAIQQLEEGAACAVEQIADLQKQVCAWQEVPIKQSTSNAVPDFVSLETFSNIPCCCTGHERQ